MRSGHAKTLGRTAAVCALLASSMVVPSRAAAQPHAPMTGADAVATAQAGIQAPARRPDPLSELYDLDLVLTRRLRAYGSVFAASSIVVGVGAILVARDLDLCMFGCTSSPQQGGRRAIGDGLLIAGLSGQAISLIGLLTAGLRRHRARRRIEEFGFTPLVMTGRAGTTGGVSMSMTW